MEDGYHAAVMQGVVVYMMLLALMLCGGIAFWFRYRAAGVLLTAGSAALLVWFAAGAPT